jgi:tetratricopeptide (TPR) repeat protein
LAYIYAEADENLEEALEMAQLAVQLSPRAAVLDTLGWVYYHMGLFEQARDPLEQAVAKSPDDVLVLEHLGDLYRQLLLIDDARQTYGRILQLQPDNPAVAEKLQELLP